MAWNSLIKITVASSTAFVVVRVGGGGRGGGGGGCGGGEMAAAAGTLWKFYSAPRKNHYISKKKPRGTIHFVLRITASVVQIYYWMLQC